AELVLLLDSNDVLGSYGVGCPQVLEVIFPVPTPIFRGEMIYIVELAAVEGTLQLAALSDVAPNLLLILNAAEITANNLMVAGNQHPNEIGTYEACRARHKNLMGLQYVLLERRLLGRRHNLAAEYKLCDPIFQ